MKCAPAWVTGTRPDPIENTWQEGGKAVDPTKSIFYARERHLYSLLSGDISRWCVLPSPTVNFSWARALTIITRMLKLGWGWWGKQGRENPPGFCLWGVLSPGNHAVCSSVKHQQSPTKLPATLCHLRVSKGWCPIISFEHFLWKKMCLCFQRAASSKKNKVPNHKLNIP